MGDHDGLFKRAFEVPAHAAGEILSLLPEAVTKKLDLSSLALEAASFVDPELAHRHADLLFTAPFRASHAFVYFLFEHQSEPDPLMPWRILNYQQRIWASALRAEPERRSLPPIITIVVHHGPSGWTAPRNLHAIIDGLDELPDVRTLMPDFELLVDDLAVVDDVSLQQRPLSAFPKVALWLLRDARNVEAFFAHLRAWAVELQEMVQDAAPQEDVEVIVRYISRVAGALPFDFFKQRIVEVAPAWEEVMATFEEQLFARGLEKGIEKGIEKARLEALDSVRRALTHLLAARFGPIDDTVRGRIAHGSASELDTWVERAAVAERIDDVFAR